MGRNGSLVSLFKEQLENDSERIADERGLSKRGDRLTWWYFLRLRGLLAADIEESVCDDGNDLGIDAIYIDEDDVVHFYQFKNPENLDKALPEGDVDKIVSVFGWTPLVSSSIAQVCLGSWKRIRLLVSSIC